MILTNRLIFGKHSTYPCLKCSRYIAAYISCVFVDSSNTLTSSYGVSGLRPPTCRQASCKGVMLLSSLPIAGGNWYTSMMPKVLAMEVTRRLRRNPTRRQTPSHVSSQALAVSGSRSLFWKLSFLLNTNLSSTESTVSTRQTRKDWGVLASVLGIRCPKKRMRNPYVFNDSTKTFGNTLLWNDDGTLDMVHIGC